MVLAALGCRGSQVHRHRAASGRRCRWCGHLASPDDSPGRQQRGQPLSVCATAATCSAVGQTTSSALMPCAAATPGQRDSLSRQANASSSSRRQLRHCFVALLLDAANALAGRRQGCEAPYRLACLNGLVKRGRSGAIPSISANPEMTSTATAGRRFRVA